MKQYSLSRQRVLAVMRRPVREEKGIAPRTVAAMVPVNPKVSEGRSIWKQEIWVLYQTRRKTTVRPTETYVISAWRYPGMTKPKHTELLAMIAREMETGQYGILENREGNL